MRESYTTLRVASVTAITCVAAERLLEEIIAQPPLVTFFAAA